MKSPSSTLKLLSPFCSWVIGAYIHCYVKTTNTACLLQQGRKVGHRDQLTDEGALLSFSSATICLSLNMLEHSSTVGLKTWIAELHQAWESRSRDASGPVAFISKSIQFRKPTTPGGSVLVYEFYIQYTTEWSGSTGNPMFPIVNEVFMHLWKNKVFHMTSIISASGKLLAMTLA